MSTLDLGKIKFLWKGTWSVSSSYVTNDVVAFNSGVWICTQTHSAGTGNEFAPGKRDRTSLYGRTNDPSEIITYNVTVQNNGVTNFFYIDGVITPTLTLYPNVKYRFMQRDGSNLAHRIGISSAIDGIFTSGGTEYTAGSTYTGTAGIDGVLDVVLPSAAPATLYFYSLNDTNFGNSGAAKISLGAGWRGWQYWDLVTSGFTFKNTWTSATSYYANDVVEYQGATYLALADSLNKFPNSPANNHAWIVMATGDRRSDHNSVAHFMNKGPIDWPYPNGNSGTAEAFLTIKWISRSGRVYNHGPGSTVSHGLAYSFNNQSSINIGQPQELCFNFSDWWNSRDNGGSGRMTTPDGLPPKCIQIEHTYDAAFMVFNNGELWACGNNANQSIPWGNSGNTIRGPVRLVGFNDVKIVKVSVTYSAQSTQRTCMALDEYGYVWTWGWNGQGACGVGHVNTVYSPARLPRSYFGGERVTDILAACHPQGSMYARTASDNLYAWGYNGISQLGDNSTTNRYRPLKMLNWDPIANNGIKKWQTSGTGGNASFMILDGNGYLWGTGYDATGIFANSTATNRTALTKSTQNPGGSIADFWMLHHATDQFSPSCTFIRTTTGATYVCGNGAANNSHVHGNNVATVQTPPQLIPAVNGINNLKEVVLHGYTGNSYRTIHFLTDAGKVYVQGNTTNGEAGHPGISATTDATDETGVTYLPILQYYPPGVKIKQILAGATGTAGTGATSYYPHGMFYMCDSGQVFANGRSRYHVNVRQSYQQATFIGFSQGISESGIYNMPINITYAR